MCQEMKAELLVVNSKEENGFIEGQIGNQDFVWLGMILHSGLNPSWKLFNGKEPTFNLLDNYMGRYSSHSSRRVDYCALLMRKRGWYPVECERSYLEGVAVCKRPFSE